MWVTKSVRRWRERCIGSEYSMVVEYAKYVGNSIISTVHTAPHPCWPNVDLDISGQEWHLVSLPFYSEATIVYWRRSPTVWPVWHGVFVPFHHHIQGLQFQPRTELAFLINLIIFFASPSLMSWLKQRILCLQPKTGRRSPVSWYKRWKIRVSSSLLIPFLCSWFFKHVCCWGEDIYNHWPLIASSAWWRWVGLPIFFLLKPTTNSLVLNTLKSSLLFSHHCTILFSSILYFTSCPSLTHPTTAESSENFWFTAGTTMRAAVKKKPKH